MRLVSNKESVARGEVSILAIVETLLAIALVFYLSAHFNTLRWLAVAMCVSPLLLLRTEKSTRLGVEWFDSIAGKVAQFFHIYGDREHAPLSHFRQFSFALIAFGGITLLTKISVTLVSALSAPSQAVRAIPKNWSRIILSTDSVSPLEMIPGHSGLSFEGFIGHRKSRGIHTLRGTALFFFIPALLYRWSVKATSIIYAPLVFVAHSTFSERADLRTKLELIKRGDLSRIRVWYGVIAIATFVVKLVLMMNLPGFADWWNGHPVSRFLALYVAPAEIPKWQLAELANSALAIGAMLFARHALLRDELKHPLPEAPVKRLLGFVSGLRWVLALYAILCTGYITMRAAQHWHWPALGEQWLPW